MPGLVIFLLALLFLVAWQLILCMAYEELEQLPERRPEPERDAQLLGWGPEIDLPLGDEE